MISKQEIVNIILIELIEYLRFNKEKNIIENKILSSKC